MSTDVKRVERSGVAAQTHAALRLTGPFVGDSCSPTGNEGAWPTVEPGRTSARGEMLPEPDGRDGESGDRRREPEGEPPARAEIAIGVRAARGVRA